MKTSLSILVLLPAMVFGQQPNLSRVQISIPGVKGVLQLDVGPTTWEARVRPDGKETQMRAMDRQDHLLITAFLQKVKFPASAEKCRDEWWPGTEKVIRSRRGSLSGLQKTSTVGMARVEYVLAEFQGKKLQMKEIHAYLGSRDLCAEIHISKVMFEPEEQKLFEEVLATVKLSSDQSATESPAPDAGKTKEEYLAHASRLYQERNYAEAAKVYQKALDLEKQDRTLSRSFFRVLVDNLGMSYGISGNLARAKETFEYGISQDPEYPLFYYNMACTYGEMGSMDEALDQLRLAYKYKENMIPGEHFPDPMTDDSFRKFVKDKKFVGAVEEMQRP